MMREEYDFSKAERGKFYRHGLKLNIPIYLDDDVSAFVEEIASKKGVDRSTVVNEILKAGLQQGAVRLFLQQDRTGSPIHVVWGIPKGYNRPVALITAYRPDVGRWDATFTRRLS